MAVPTEATEPVAWLPALLMTAWLVVLGVLLTATIRNRIARRDNETPDPREMIDRIHEPEGAGPAVVIEAAPEH